MLGYKFGGCSDGDVFLFLLGLERDCVRERKWDTEEERDREKESFRFESSDLERENKWISIFVGIFILF